MYGRSAKLIYEVSKVCLIEIHKFMDIRKAERTTGRRRRWRGQRAAEDMGESIEEMREEPAIL